MERRHIGQEEKELKNLSQTIRLPPSWTFLAESVIQEVTMVLEQHCSDQSACNYVVGWKVVGGYAKQTSTRIKADVDLGMAFLMIWGHPKKVVQGAF